jgi:hypothetical protein
LQRILSIASISPLARAILKQDLASTRASG